ncbi:MAG: DUF1800 family protein [Chitinophagales bacterium]|nr:DUF1800 family protein [Chitinophagales bacterium]
MASLQAHTAALGSHLAAHLLRRTTFRPTRARIEQFATLTPQQALDALLLIQTPTVSEPTDPLTGQPWINSGIDPESGNQQLRNYVKSWWLNEALLDESMGSKMQFFLHNCYTAAAVTGGAAEFFDYLALLRYYAIGNFKVLAGKVTFDNLMLRYLDNTENNKNSPNQNYARELLELFTIGKGPQIGAGNYTNYTEDDIIAAARVLTGIKTGNRATNIDPITGIPNGRIVVGQHDTGNKTFSAAFQNTVIEGGNTIAEIAQELYAFVDMVFVQSETARFICRRLYRYFVSKNISDEIAADIIEPLAATLRDNDYELVPVLRQLLESQHFYDLDDSDNSDEIIGGLIKSPLELALGSLTYFQVEIPLPTQPQAHYQIFYARGMIQTMFVLAGFDPFAPPDVAGYPAYYQTPDYNRAWFNGSTIIARYKLPEMLLSGMRVLAGGPLGAQLHIVDFIQAAGNISNSADAQTLVNELLLYLLPNPPDANRRDYFLNTIFLDGLPAEDWTYEWQNFVATGNDEEVRLPLEKLIKAIMYSPEYQLF